MPSQAALARLPTNMTLPLFALAVAAFAVGTAEFIVVGLLPEVAAAFAVDIPQAGLLVTAYALGVVVGGPILTIFASGLSRKLTLLLLLGLFIAGNLLCAIAPSFGLMMAARILTAFVHAAFFGVAVVVAADLVPQNRRASAMALVFAGLTVAHILGIPGGAALGHAAGWRVPFVAIALIGIGAMVMLAVVLPGTLRGAERRAGFAREFAVLRKPQVLLVFLLAMLPGGGAGTTYAFIVPLLDTFTGVRPENAPWYLMAIGVGGTIGIFLGGRLADWKLMPSLVATLAVLIVVYLLLLLSLRSPPLMFVMTGIWGLTIFATGTPLQAKAVAAAIEAPNLASTLNQSATNLGNAAGPAIGAAALAMGVGLGSLPWLALAITVVAFALACLILVLDRRPAAL
jgi:MFS transporter, DHA1 family, inner membrane transport protein